MKNNDTAPVLDIQNLAVKFRMYDKGLRQTELQVISDINLSIKAGEIVAVAGSSGSGKSLLAHAILGILPKNAAVSGSMKYCGTELTPAVQASLRGRDIALVPQSVSYLDPLKKVGPQVQGLYGTKEQQAQVFKRFELTEETAEKYPFQLSGGMARRVLVSTAVISDAKLIIADEPTPGLNPEIAEKTMKFFHPYSRALWNALPQNGFQPISGGQPYAGSLQCGCPYAARCNCCSAECTAAKTIKMQTVRGGEVRCCHAT